MAVGQGGCSIGATARAGLHHSKGDSTAGLQQWQGDRRARLQLRGSTLGRLQKGQGKNTVMKEQYTVCNRCRAISIM